MPQIWLSENQEWTLMYHVGAKLESSINLPHLALSTVETFKTSSNSILQHWLYPSVLMLIGPRIVFIVA